jgi:hypothetical protein
MADSKITKVTTHVQDAKDRLTGQYKGKPRIEGTVGLLAKQIQDLEDVLTDLLEAEILANAQGAFLDQLGDLVGQEREGLQDDFYRILIAVKIVKNFSKGEPDAIIRATRLIFQASEVHYMNLGGANVGLYVNGITPDVPSSFIYSNLQEVAAAGVKILFVAVAPPDTDPEDVFAFDGGETGGGFGSLSDPDIGGAWSGLI